MKSVAYIVRGKSGDYVKASLVPTNHSEDTRYCWVDFMAITVVLAGLSSLFYLLLR